MKIEKINENQIRCILNSTDLSERQIDLNELAYGSGKARQLFREMIETACHDFDFEVEDTPLMVEAIPLPLNSIMLIISKIEDPEELDCRYSRFASSFEDDILSDLMSLPMQLLEGAADAVRRQLAQQAAPVSREQAAPEPEPAPASESEPESGPADALRIFSFPSLRDLAYAASFLKDANDICVSTLYRLEDGVYHLVLMPSELPDANYSRICNVLAEFGDKVPGGLPAAAYHEEHYEKILERTALPVIAKIY